ncbi:MAG: nuclear transport factor 2 family protein [Smithella sp.]
MDGSDNDNVKPLDKLLNDKAKEFESGEDRLRDKELDTLIWELGDYETEEPEQEAREFEDEKPIEEELAEKTVVKRRGRELLKEDMEATDSMIAEEEIAAVRPIGRGNQEKEKTIILHKLPASDKRVLESHKKIVRAFYEMLFNEHNPAEAAKKYMGKKYIQHNPYMSDGEEAFREYFKGYFEEHPKTRVEIKRIIAEGDLVVLHLHSKMDENDRGRAMVEIFRLEDDKIVEHWGVTQAVPARAANRNTMF